MRGNTICVLTLPFFVLCGDCGQHFEWDASTDVARDTGIDAIDVSRIDVLNDAGGVSDVQGCQSTPDALGVTFDGGDCGPGCSVLRGIPAAPDGSGWIFGERPGEVEFGGYSTWLRVDESTGRETNPWPWPFPQGCGVDSQGGITGAVVGPRSTGIVCTEDARYVLREIDRVTGQNCVRYARPEPQPLPDGLTPAADLQRTNGAWLWTEAPSHWLGQVFVLQDGDAEPRQIDAPPGSDALFMVAGGDVALWNRRPGLGPEQLVLSRAPFTDVQVVWTSPGHLAHLALDPENPNHLVFDAWAGGALCAAGADIYYLDVSTAETVPPRALTHNLITELGPQIRGDRVAYSDFADDTLNPGGCIEDPHSTTSLVTTSLMRGGRTFVRAVAGLIWLGRDRVWFPFGTNTGVQLIPPG
jgi:hypothetical protein